MFRGLFLFEIKFRLKQISTYVYFALWFSMAFIAVSVREFGGGKVFVNSPYNISQLMVWLTTFGLIFMPAFFGMSILRDFEQDTYQIFFTTPIKKRDYLGGRLLGSLVITVLIFSGIIFGLIAGKFMPWADQARLAPINIWFHVQPFLLFSVTEIIFAGATFFMVGALTRNIVFIYAQGIVFLAALLIFQLLIFIIPERLAALIDPLGISSFEYVSRYWTIAEKNTMTIPFSGVMAWNRLLWLGVGALATAVTFLCFPFSAETLAVKFARKSSIEDAKEKAPPALIQFSILALFLQTVLPNKFLGHTLVIGIVIAQVAIAKYGFESCLYQFGETPDYKIKVSAKKLRADGLGAEKEIQIDDLVDIGVFSGWWKYETLFLARRRITQPETEFELTVDKRPTSAGIDPYNKLIDRNPDDNVVTVNKSR